ncbi:EAL domain-containing protein [Vibrio mimicus]
MTSIIAIPKGKLTSPLWANLFFHFGLMIVSYTLIVEHPAMAQLYQFFPVLLLIAFWVPKRRVRGISALVAILLIIIGNFFSPLNVDAVEEAFLLLPLIYVVLMPATVWPMIVAVLLVMSYLYSIDNSLFSEFAEDATELLVITAFAAGGTYYRLSLLKQIKRYRRDSLTDFLTSLGNRKAFQIQLHQIQKQNQASQYALIQVDLDDFKQINDSLGHQQGDKLLEALGRRLKTLQNQERKIYRLSSDEFALVLHYEDKLHQAIELTIEQLSNTLNQEFRLGKRTYSVTISIGVALLEDALNDVDIWCRNADIAILKAKGCGKNCVRWFDDELLGETIRQFQIERELNIALEHNQLLMHYQPKVDIRTGRIVGVEALVRWQHPELGMINPGDFIEIAEKTQQIIPIGRWVIYEACRQLNEWHNAYPFLSMSVNVSNIQFLYDDIYSVIYSALETYPLPPHVLQLEITETTLMRYPHSVIQTCHRLRELGIQIALDDFGVAYSSLNYLKQLPIDVIKIDRSFVDSCVDSQVGKMIIRTIIQLGHNLGKVVTAEGVDSEEKLAILKAEGCDKYQGFLFSRPVLPNEIEALLLKSKAETE